jgi:hypothetical protein
VFIGSAPALPSALQPNLVFLIWRNAIMANIRAVFRNTYSESRRWVIVDTGRDPNSPPTIYDGYLDPDGTTDPLDIYSGDGIYGQVQYQRADGAPTVEANIVDGSEVRMQ